MAPNGSHHFILSIVSFVMKPELVVPRAIRDAFASLYEPESLRLLADLYWTTSLLVGSILMVSGAGYGAYVLLGRPDPVISNVIIGSGTGGFSRTKLKDLIVAYEARRARFESIKRTPPTIASPDSVAR